MPRVVDYAPAWLSRPSPGATFFSSSNSNKYAERDTESYFGPIKILARRGTEVFAVVDNQIRWANLSLLKDQWQERVRQKRKETGFGSTDGGSSFSGSIRIPKNGGLNGKGAVTDTGDDGTSFADSSSHYRVLTAPIYGQIRQLVISPNGAFLAILTSHTIHIAILPDSSHLSGPDFSPLRLRTYQLGPATHVIPESPVICALWHPLGVYDSYGGCIITVTADSAVRVWEVDRRDHWSFDRPALAIDLKKLVDGTSSEEDFAPSGFGQNKGFSADVFDMEAASACFGGHGYDDENAWAPMTLWISMRQGDVYALCPLLPSKWRSPSLAIPCLTASIVHKLAAAQEDMSKDDDERKAVEQQYTWLQDIDSQDPISLADDSGFSEIRSRPTKPSPIPRLQGPFQFSIEEEPDDLDITDIFVIAAKSETEDLLAGEDGDLLGENKQEGISGTIICLATEKGMVHIALEMDGIEGQWLPRKSQGTFTMPVSEASELLLLESLETVREKYYQANSWPTFTGDAVSRYNFFVTTANSVTFISLSSWAQRIEPELQSEDTTGSSFRINIICDGVIAEREQLIQLPESRDDSPEHLTNSSVMYDFDLGYMLLTYAPSQVSALVLESAATGDLESAQDLIPVEPDTNIHQAYMGIPQRAPYQVPSVLYSINPLETFINDHVPHGRRHALKDPIRLSPSTLDVITSAHRILSAYTHALEKAASDLFRRCERLQGEMRDQLCQLVDIAERINDVSRGTVRRVQRPDIAGREEALDSRMAAVQSKQKELILRYNSLRSKLMRAGGRPISDKEKGWIREVDTLTESIGGADGDERTELLERLKTAKSLAKELVSESKRRSDNSNEATPARIDARSSPLHVPPRLQKAKVADAMNMVEREAAVIDAITSRLERLSTSMPEP
ncbi:hypothetical protein CPC735_054720 [Coccidioides posadasii C735 delta SOWgp]|uniref:Nuclear pore complex protein An-Nup82 n=1 Tax=Coccidioides posadasii (strain C735) TaxID=222929 RepID=C5PHU9_COCP7|nr:hypothetical protein CPC735_054720 [Coccidioides posadasii C735 delta SOWgp]EER24102.1 hypothetical protein CPC735_054720 [Coccidioides posadasii C735 delta SOWgp]|eukprot:XP_003066247.1 hypothetical protein CPC735_054720 [Coccidioides posadasii C735 delta SOWgp]